MAETEKRERSYTMRVQEFDWIRKRHAPYVNNSTLSLKSE